METVSFRCIQKAFLTFFQSNIIIFFNVRFKECVIIKYVLGHKQTRTFETLNL